MPEGVGALGRNRDKLGQERHESRLALELPREMSTDVPYVGVPGQRYQRQVGRNTHTHTHGGVWVSWWGDANSDTYITHKSHRETEKECRNGKSG